MMKSSMKEKKSTNVFIYLINKGGFKSLDENGFLSYENLGIEDKIILFIKKRLDHFGFKNIEIIKDIKESKEHDNNHICYINIVNPFIDTDLLSNMLGFLDKNPDLDGCKPSGAIPGTEPDLVLRSNKTKDIKDLNIAVYNHDTQEKYNNQFNLRKLKRVKIFSNIIDYIPEISKMKIPDIVKRLHEKDIFEKLASYFEEVDLEYLDRCPCCKSNLKPLISNVSQNFIGYIPFDKPWYYQCEKCKLIVLSPYVNSKDAEKLYDFYNSEGQSTKYFINRGARQSHYDRAISMLEKIFPNSINGIDLGCGSGAFLYYIKERKKNWNMIGCDYSQRVDYYKEGQKEIKVLNMDFLKQEIGNNEYDLITAWEVIEHIPFSDVKIMIDKVYNALKQDGVFLFSTPDFDSPLSQMFDFYASSPPHHPLVFSKSWMEYYFKNNPKFEIIKIENESAMLEIYESWFGYWKDTSKSFESRSAANFILELFREKETKNALDRFIKNREWGTDMIVSLRKK